MAGSPADVTATTALRERLVQARGRLPMFDRGPYFSALKASGKVEYPEPLARSGQGLVRPAGRLIGGGLALAAARG